MKRLSLIMLGTLALIFGCGEEAAESGVVAAECVQADLVEQCPPNTAPVLEADSAAVCQQDTSIDVDGVTGSGDGSVSNVCVGTASCKVVCELTDPCLYGIQTISPTEGVVCFIPDGGCGDGDCGVGEDPVLCPQDCAAECEPNIARCTDGLLERCSSNGRLEAPVSCAEGQRCVDPEGAEGARCVENLCGDGTISDGEECDDGNDVNTDACTNACTLPICGDGIVNANEECDEGDLNSDMAADTCRTNCKLPFCGDGVKDPGLGEGCDDGNNDNGDECTSECIPADCSDGIVDGEEECDDGMGNSDTQPNACRTNCLRAYCGDDVRDAGEECDDGVENGAVCMYGAMSCEVCSDTCRNVMGDTSFCGDTHIDAMAGEQCDDGNQVTEVCPYSQMSCVVCNASCQETAGAVAYCGDGTEDGAARTGGMAEGCDNGSNNGNSRLCKSDCTPAVCGDGHHLTQVRVLTNPRFEFCDDGNEFNLDDGCNTDCELTERRENLNPPLCDLYETGACDVGVGTEQDGGGCVEVDGGNRPCLYTNPIPLYRVQTRSNVRQGRIHGVLSYNGTANNGAGRRDVDVFGFEQLCGHDSIIEDRDEQCIDENAASNVFVVDYTGAGIGSPFSIGGDCNGRCLTPTVTFCEEGHGSSLCLNKPAGKERAFWCTPADRVGEYRIWLELQADAAISYTLTLKENLGEPCP